MQKALGVSGSPAQPPKKRGEGRTCMWLKGRGATEEDDDDVTHTTSHRKPVRELGAKPGFPSWPVACHGAPTPPYEDIPPNQVWGRSDLRTREINF